MKLTKPTHPFPALARDVVFAALTLTFVSAIAVVVGLKMDPQNLGNWGSWVGAFIAGVALVASAYAVILQARFGESTSWNIALARLGEVYDMAQENEKLARIIAEPIDYSEHSDGIDPDDLSFSPQEIIWMGSLFLAFEQIYVATNSLSPESKRVWRLYLRNQLNKPTIRAAFVRDATNAKDFHHDFWQFVRGKSTDSAPGYRDYSIHPRFFSMLDGRRSTGERSSKKVLIQRAAEQGDLPFLLELYSDPVVKQQMYAAPLESPEALDAFLKDGRQVYVVSEKDRVIGMFSLTKLSTTIATFGIAVHKEFRGVGYGSALAELVEAEAHRAGYKTLRADVYCDNISSVRLLEKNGFRKFIWLEKNI